MGAFIDLTGQRFGKLTVVRPVRCANKIHWECQCDCGNTTRSHGSSLRQGAAKSCGCSRKTAEFRENAGRRWTKHGYFGTKEYNIWGGMIDRCENPKSKTWRRYGGRGITVDAAWRHDPAKFIADMGPRPSPRHTVDRIDVNGPYAPWNCRWATPVEQGNNRRSNVNLTYMGKTQTVAQWAREIGVSRTTLADRLKSRSVEDAINFTHVQVGVLIEFEGERKLLREWASILGFSQRGLRKRLKTMSVAEAFTTPKRKWPSQC